MRFTTRFFFGLLLWVLGGLQYLPAYAASTAEHLLGPGDLLQITVTQLENALQNVQKQREIAEKLLKFQMGMEFNQPIVLTDSLEDILSQADIAAAFESEFNLESNIDYRLLEETDLIDLMVKGDEKAMEEHDRRTAPLLEVLRELSRMQPLDATI